MGGNAVSGEVVVYGQLVELVSFKHLNLAEPLKQFAEKMRNAALLLVFVDLIPAILKLKAVMLNPAIIKPLPLP